MRLENEPRLPSWFVFADLSLRSIPLTTLVLNTSISDDDMTRDHHNNDMNPTKGLGSVRRESNDNMTRDHHHNNDTNPTKGLGAV